MLSRGEFELLRPPPFFVTAAPTGAVGSVDLPSEDGPFERNYAGRGGESRRLADIIVIQWGGEGVGKGRAFNAKDRGGQRGAGLSYSSKIQTGMNACLNTTGYSHSNLVKPTGHGSVSMFLSFQIV